MGASSLLEIPGHASAKRALQGLYRHQECHAVLFYGPQNSACIDFARQLAASWLCPNANENGACGACPICLGFWKDTPGATTLDYLEVVPKPPSRIIRVAAITSTRGERADPNDPPAVRDFFRTHPLQARQKVVCIVDADRLNPAAANALLKLLEEPDSRAKVVLTTHALSQVLPTVISRTLAVVCESEQGSAIEISDEVQTFLSRLVHRPKDEALKAAEEMRDMAERGAEDGGKRTSHVEILKSVAQWLIQSYPERPEWALSALEAQRKIAGNGNASVVLDAWIARWMAEL